MIEFVEGNIFKSNADAILHQVNCQGVMGAGIAKAIRKRYPNVFQEYRKLCDKYKLSENSLLKSNLLGSILVCPQVVNLDDSETDDKKFIVNLFAQDRYGRDRCQTDYKALQECLSNVNKEFSGKEIAIPYKMSCNRGGGDWNIVLKIIEEELKDCYVKIYKLKE